MHKYLLVGVLLFLAACKKDEGSQKKEIKGVVVNIVTKQPVAGQRVELTIITQKIVKTKNDPEFPNGKPVFYYTKYQTTSDQAGQYLFDVRIPNGPWSYNVVMPKGEFIMSYYSFLRPFPIDERFWKLQDSIFIERPGYVRYTIKTPGANSNEMLYISTPQHMREIWPANILRLGDYRYNWAFLGRADEIQMDTIPAESITNPEVEWARTLANFNSIDTIVHKKDTIHVRPGAIIDYSILY